jgi:hypothetical protein
MVIKSALSILDFVEQLIIGFSLYSFTHFFNVPVLNWITLKLPDTWASGFRLLEDANEQ